MRFMARLYSFRKRLASVATAMGSKGILWNLLIRSAVCAGFR